MSRTYAELNEKINEVIELNEKAKKIVAGFAVTAAGTGAVPIPFADFPLLIGEQVTMMSSICAVYGIRIKKEGLKMLVIQVLGVSGTTMVGKTFVSNLLKFIPGLGSLAGGAISATTAGALTLSLGMTFIKICEEVKLGKLSENDMLSKKTAKRMRELFQYEMQH